ncbi:MAG: aminoglycoside phosphotransferase family protein [Bacteroidetes bacterium]|nr:aminoglycoside phosphotransferase family protein [Bacteroidota bacterium]
MDNLLKDKLIETISHFEAESPFESVSSIESGHINDSYVISCSTKGSGYVLQRINHQVFKKIPELIDNILIVTRHIEKKLSENGEPDCRFVPLQLVQVKNGGYYYQDQTGNYWRVFKYIEGSKSYDRVDTPQLAYEGGKAWGHFHFLTSDIPMDSLVETIPDFHNIDKRSGSFREAVKNDPVLRAKNIMAEIDFVESRTEEMRHILKPGNDLNFPLRVTHNDTKFNNILFNDNAEAICIVDLDTVMPGFVLYDFGDAIRTGTNTCNEDEIHLEKVTINLQLFESYSHGYLKIARNFLTREEIHHLAFSAKFMTYIIGLRFLTDYLEGDKYFKIHSELHNLQRARAQFRLLSEMEQQYSTMQKIIDNYSN